MLQLKNEKKIIHALTILLTLSSCAKSNGENSPDCIRLRELNQEKKSLNHKLNELQKGSHPYLVGVVKQDSLNEEIQLYRKYRCSEIDWVERRQEEIKSEKEGPLGSMEKSWDF